VSFIVPRGAIVALTGANGAGKSTALDVVATLLLPTSGDVRVFGASVRTSPAEVRRRVAYCPAGGASFWPRLTGRENLDCFSALAGVSPRDRPRRLTDAASRVGLSAEVLSRETRTYSDGQMQRLNLARALMRDVTVWLLDEPTRSLDAEAQEATWTLIRESARERGVSVLVATHDAMSVTAHADAVVRLE
jgi:ABC-2 type transport system ATP-binding protein